MDRKEKIKKWIKDHEDYIYGGLAAVAGVVVYSYGCKTAGYRMNKPYMYDDKCFYVKTVTGKILQSEKF